MRRSYFLLSSMFYIVVVAFLTSCEVHKVDPEQKTNITAFSKEMADIEGDFIVKYNKFYERALALVGKVRLLTNHPGWPDMAAIITSNLSIVYIEGGEKASQKLALSMTGWNQKYQADGEKIFAKYGELLAESAAVESKRRELSVACDNIVFALLPKTFNLNYSDSHIAIEELKRKYVTIKENLFAFRVGTLGLFEMNAR